MNKQIFLFFVSTFMHISGADQHSIHQIKHIQDEYQSFSLPHLEIPQTLEISTCDDDEYNKALLMLDFNIIDDQDGQQRTPDISNSFDSLNAQQTQEANSKNDTIPSAANKKQDIAPAERKWHSSQYISGRIIKTRRKNSKKSFSASTQCLRNVVKQLHFIEK